MARNRRRKAGCLSRLLLVAVVIMALYIVATRGKAYLDDQQMLQRYVNDHSTTAPATPGR